MKNLSANELHELVEELLKHSSLSQKLAALEEMPLVSDYLRENPDIREWIFSFAEKERCLLLTVVAIGQAPCVFAGLDVRHPEGIKPFLEVLDGLDSMYDTIGGIAGYHLAFIRLLEEKKDESRPSDHAHYEKPAWIDIEELDFRVKNWIKKGLESLPLLAEIYPVGGAGDRLGLTCSIKGEPLPAAELPFIGMTLLAILIRDLQAREYLYYKLFGRQVTIPVALMTSDEKQNDARLKEMLNAHGWFGRPKSSIRLFKQPLVPLITEEGFWAMKKALKPHLKPGGHGVVWKLALGLKIFDWFEALGKTKGLIRQINNPVAGTDYGLLAFTGVGFEKDKKFGFASCPRLAGTAEGTDIVLEKKVGKGFAYTLSNIEYTVFKERGIVDEPVSDDNPHSAYPSNTNILFFDFEAIKKAVAACPVPGMLINLKNRVKCLNPDLSEEEFFSGRVESTMQNISDFIVLKSEKRLTGSDLLLLPSFITYNKRRKTLSVAKTAYKEGHSLVGTPQGCLYEMMQNRREMLSKFCGMDVPKLCDEKTYISRGLNFFLLFHPSLGPVWSVIAQKIRGGSMAENSDMVLEIAELEMEKVSLDGSLIIKAESVMGKKDPEKGISYGPDCGRCVLKGVTIRNKGIDRSSMANRFWKNDLKRAGALEIHLEGKSAFIAEGVSFQGARKIIVPDGVLMRAYEKEGKVVFKENSIEESGVWDYKFDENQNIILKK